MKGETVGFLIGYFVVLSPVHYAMVNNLTFGLIHAIIGWAGTIAIEIYDNKGDVVLK